MVGPTKTIYEEYPLLGRVRNVLNSVENTENSTGKAQYKILQTAQKPGQLAKLRGPYMSAFNWSKLKNDQRLSASQRKTVNKILVSLKVPARDKFRNRPAILFDPTGMNIATVNKKLRDSIATRPAAQASPSTQRQVPVQMRNNPTFVPNESNLQTARQHREAFGN